MSLVDEHDLQTPRGRLYSQRWQPAGAGSTAILLFHDSLGSVQLWRDFPSQLAEITGLPVIAYDRLGFGRSDPHPGALSLDFVAEEARESLPLLRAHWGLERYIALGHSIGGGMAAVCAAEDPQRCVGLITESSQAFVEERTREGIRAAEQDFARPGQMDRLVKYHGDKAHWVLRAWVETWLSPAFAHWNLDAVLPRVRCPLLSLHGENDEFGSPQHPQRFAERVQGPATVQILPDCGHVPHREQTPAVLQAVSRFMAGLARVGA